MFCLLNRLLQVSSGVIQISVLLAFTQAQIIVEHICNLLPCGFRQFNLQIHAKRLPVTVIAHGSWEVLGRNLATVTTRGWCRDANRKVSNQTLQTPRAIGKAGAVSDATLDRRKHLVESL